MIIDLFEVDTKPKSQGEGKLSVFSRKFEMWNGRVNIIKLNVEVNPKETLDLEKYPTYEKNE